MGGGATGAPFAAGTGATGALSGDWGPPLMTTVFSRVFIPDPGGGFFIGGHCVTVRPVAHPARLKLGGYCAPRHAQCCAMHCVCAPPAHAQQSELAAHFSYSWAQPLWGGT